MCESLGSISRRENKKEKEQEGMGEKEERKGKMKTYSSPQPR